MTDEITAAFVRDEYVWADHSGDKTRAEYEAEFDNWLAEVERAAAEKAYERCVREMPFDTDWKIFYVDNNPYRAAAYRREETE